MPFSAAQFFDVFRRYNEAVWPAQPLLVVLAVAAAALASTRSRALARAALLIVAMFWLWTGVAYHWLFFAAINPIARLFAILCVVQAILLAIAKPADEPPRRFIGLVLIAVALIGYPLLGLLAGERYPSFPTFGAPCPTTIFTFGMLVLLPARRMLFVVPVLWAAVGTAGAISFGVPQDFLLPLSAVISLITRYNPRPVWPTGRSVISRRSRATWRAGGS